MLATRYSARQRGLTLLELMIGLLIGLIISGTMLSTWLNMQTSALTALQQSRLHQDLRAINYIMVRDIRRAGYWGWTPDSGIAVTENPFMTTANNINIDRADNNETDASCLTYSYDLDHDGLVGATSVEQFGFRLHDQAIEMRTGGTTFSCRDGLWQDITQTGTIITSLRFSMHNEIIAPTTGCNPGQTCIRRRLVNISLTGHLQSRPDQSITLEEQISIRNDHLSLSV